MKSHVTEILLIFLLTGCAAIKGVIPSHAFTQEEMRHHVGVNSLKVITLKAKVEVTVESPELQSPLSCQGYLRLERPKKLRLVCSKFFSTIFDIASDGREFWLYVPGEKKAYTGNANQKITYLGLNFSPNDVAGLLDFEEILSSKRLLIKPTPEYWAIHVFNACGLTLSDLHVDKKTLQVSYIESYNPDGSLRLQAALGEYQTIGDCSLPRSLGIYWQAGETHLTFSLGKITVNETLDPRVFQLSIPKGVEILRITDGYVGHKAVSQ